VTIDSPICGEGVQTCNAGRDFHQTQADFELPITGVFLFG